MNMKLAPTYLATTVVLYEMILCSLYHSGNNARLLWFTLCYSFAPNPNLNVYHGAKSLSKNAARHLRVIQHSPVVKVRRVIKAADARVAEDAASRDNIEDQAAREHLKMTMLVQQAGQEYLSALMADDAIEYITGTNMRVIKNLPSLEHGPLPRNVVIRAMEENFWNACIDVCENPGKNWSVSAIGNRALGKTMSTNLLIRMLLQKGKTVVYLIRTENSRNWFFEFTPQPGSASSQYSCSVYRETRQADPMMIKSLQDCNTYHIVVDQGDVRSKYSVDPTLPAKIIRVEPPVERQLHRRVPIYRNSVRMYFPVWSLEELLVANEYIAGSSLNSTQVRHRYDKVGGVPGHVFAHHIQLQQILMAQQSAVRTLDFTEARMIASGRTVDNGILSQNARLCAVFGFETTTDPNFRTAEVVVLSQGVRKRALIRAYILLAAYIWSEKNIHDDFEIFSWYAMFGDTKNYKARHCVGRGHPAYDEIFLANLGGCREVRAVADIIANAKLTQNAIFYSPSRESLLVDFIYSRKDSSGKLCFFAFCVASGKDHIASTKRIKQFEALIGPENIPNTYLYFVTRTKHFGKFVTNPTIPKASIKVFHLEMNSSSVIQQEKNSTLLQVEENEYDNNSNFKK